VRVPCARAGSERVPDTLLLAAARFDLGTSDELALDVLINTLSCFSKECACASGTHATCEADAPPARRHLPITQLVIGGINADWKEGADALRKQLDAE
jgi:hypothetical protein